MDNPVNFHALYTPGNHCYDGGDTMLYDALKGVNGVSVVMSNIDEENSPAIDSYNFDKKGSNFVTSKEFEIEDIIAEFKKHGVRVRVKEMANRNDPMLEIETHYVVEDIERFKINVGK